MNKAKIEYYIKRAEEEISLLPDKPEETYESTIRALWLLAAGRPVSVVDAKSTDLPDLDDEMEKRLNSFIEKRAKGEPLSHITGIQRFMGTDFKVGPGALIPRRETEILGYAVIDLLNQIKKSDNNSSLTLIDACTGMGNLALSMALKFENIHVFATDISGEAISLAKENAVMLSLENRVSFSAGDLFENFLNDEFFHRVDIITCNPPYISAQKIDQMPAEIKDYEPREAFAGGNFGITILSRLINDSLKLLKNGGWLCFEVGLGQGELLIKKIEKTGRYSLIKPVNDAESNVRALLLQKSNDTAIMKG